jgi:hypothetical protein
MISLANEPHPESSRELTETQLLLKQMVLNSVTAPNTRPNYSKSLDDLFAFAAGRLPCAQDYDKERDKTTTFIVINDKTVLTQSKATLDK